MFGGKTTIILWKRYGEREIKPETETKKENEIEKWREWEKWKVLIGVYDKRRERKCWVVELI